MAAGATPMLVSACSDAQVTCCSNYFASQRSALPLMQLELNKRRQKRQALLKQKRALGRTIGSVEKKRVEALLQACPPCVTVQAANDYNGEKANSYFSRYMRRHNRYSPRMVGRARRGLAQGWLREIHGRIGKLQKLSRRRTSVQCSNSLSNTTIITPCLVRWSGSELVRAKSGRRVGEFVHVTVSKTKTATSSTNDDSESDIDDDPDGEDDESPDLQQTEFAAAEAIDYVIAEAEAAHSEDEDATSSGDVGETQFDAQCEACFSWRSVSEKQQTTLSDRPEIHFFCSEECRVGSAAHVRAASSSRYHDEWMAGHLHTPDNRVQGIKIAVTKTEQQERNVQHRAALLKRELGDEHVAVLENMVVVAGHGAQTCRALPELFTHLGLQLETNKTWRPSSLPPVILLSVNDSGARVIETADGVAQARPARVDEVIEACLAIELAKCDWEALGSSGALARVVSKATTKTNGVCALTTCVGHGGKEFPRHTMCPVCGVDWDSVPVGVDLPSIVPLDANWKLDPAMHKPVDGCIAAQVHTVLEREYENVNDKSLGAAMAADVTGETLYTDLEQQSLEWMVFIGNRCMGVQRLQKRLKEYLVLQCATHEGASKGRKEAWLLNSLRSLRKSRPNNTLTFYRGQKVKAQWMVKERKNAKRRKKSGTDLIADPSKPGVSDDWFDATVVGAGKGVGVCYKLLFFDGHTHLGVPIKNMRRV